MRWTVAIALVCLWPLGAQAQTAEITNRWQPAKAIKLYKDAVIAGPANDKTVPAQWVVEPVAGVDAYRLRSVADGTYLNVETGTLRASAIQPDWTSAQWVIERVPGSDYVRIRNVWKGTFLNIESGKLDLGPVQPDWQSAMWGLVWLSRK